MFSLRYRPFLPFPPPSPLLCPWWSQPPLFLASKWSLLVIIVFTLLLSMRTVWMWTISRKDQEHSMSSRRRRSSRRWRQSRGGPSPEQKPGGCSSCAKLARRPEGLPGNCAIVTEQRNMLGKFLIEMISRKVTTMCIKILACSRRKTAATKEAWTSVPQPRGPSESFCCWCSS